VYIPIGLEHRAHLQFVHIHLQEDSLSELLCVLDKQWSDGTARTAPGGSEVNDHLKGCTS